MRLQRFLLFAVLVSSTARADWNVSHGTPPTGSSGTVTDVTGSAPLTVTNGTSTPAISITKSDSTHAGYLGSADWQAFNGKQASGSYANQSTAINTTSPLTGGGDLSTTRTLAIPAGTSSANGYLASGDWVTFNAKQAAGAYVTTARSVSTTAPLAGGGALSGDLTLSLPAASVSANGYLTSGDWSTFSAKQTATLAHFNAWAGNSSNVAEAFDSTLLGDIKADAKHQTTTMALGTGVGGFQPVEITATGHGRVDGDKLYFTTTGALYQPLAVSTTYYAYVLDANSIRVCATYDEAINHAACRYSQTSLPPIQSGVHTVWMGGLKIGTLGAIPPAETLSLLGTSNARVLTLAYDDSVGSNQSMRFIFPATFPSAGQFLQVDTALSPTLEFKWGTPAGAAWTLAPFVCLAIGANFNNDDFSADGGSCTANFGGVTYGQGSGAAGAFAQGDRILFVNTGSGNQDDGLYYADTGGSVIRATDADTEAKLNGGTVTEFNDALGSAYNHSLWTQTANIVTLGTTPQNWVRAQTVAPSSPQATGACTVSSTTISTTPSNVTCTGVPASAGVSVTCSGAAAFSTATAGGLYARATGTADQLALNTGIVNTTAMTFACSWVQP